MKMKMKWHDAIYKRTSRRTYTGKSLNKEQKVAIGKLVATINEESGLNFQFIENGKELFNNFNVSYGLLKGVNSVIALVSDKEVDPTFVGYYGQFLDLECVALGLGTCWFGLTYSEEVASRYINLDDQSKIIASITVGVVEVEKSFREKLISRIGKNKQSFNELLQVADEGVPEWVRSGIEAARLSPSAMNQKPVGYSYVLGQLKVFAAKDVRYYKEVDLGISMAQFQVGAAHAGVEGVWDAVEGGFTFRIQT